MKLKLMSVLCLLLLSLQVLADGQDIVGSILVNKTDDGNYEELKAICLQREAQKCVKAQVETLYYKHGASYQTSEFSLDDTKAFKKALKKAVGNNCPGCYVTGEDLIGYVFTATTPLIMLSIYDVTVAGVAITALALPVTLAVDIVKAPFAAIYFGGKKVSEGIEKLRTFKYAKKLLDEKNAGQKLKVNNTIFYSVRGSFYALTEQP